MASPMETQFNEAMLDIYRKAKSEAKYNAIRFLQMVTDHGGIATAHILINSPTVSDGYTALWERDRLDLTVESMILENEEFHELFSKEELAICRERLSQYLQKRRL
ncbi:MAG: hypothetical protein KKD73_01820 [Proteobacteria bacterium]|nr:hypothetical protein [Pseudomonadota bacterium]MBU1640108.1 hypothetical protein [Pseudomonadota bacterium]